MDVQANRTLLTALLAGCLVSIVVIASVGTGIGAAQEGLDVSLDVPDEATAGEETTLSASVSTPELRGNHQSDLTVTFSADGEQIASETVTIADGETTEVTITHTFDEAGTVEVTAEAEVTIATQEYSASTSRTIEVVEPPDQISIDGDLRTSIEVPDNPTAGESTQVSVENEIPSFAGEQEATLSLRILVDGEEAASKTVTVTDGETTTTDFAVVFESSGETTVTAEAELIVGNKTLTKRVSKTVDVAEATPDTTLVEGAAFAIPKSLEDEVAEYRETSGHDLNMNAFVLGTQNELYVVFTQQKPQKGAASVEGIILKRNLSSENFEFGVIAATRTSFRTRGSEVSVQQVVDNSEDYRLEMVRITANHRRVSLLTDPDGGENITLSTTSGILVENPRSATSLFQNVGGKARAVSRDPSPKQIDTTLSDPRRPHLHTFSFETKFWTDAEATVDAIVLDPNSAARKFIEAYDQSGIAHAEDGEPLLYVVSEDFQPRSVEDVASIKSQSESLDGEVVETEVRLYQEQISVQETLEHNTGCDEEVMQVQTPQGPACVNVVQDTLLHGGAAWTTVPRSREDVLFVMGASSNHLDSPEQFEQGRYRIVGEVVSTSRIDDSLPEGSVLVIYEMKRQGDIDYEEVASEAKGIIETRSDQLATRLRAQVGGEDVRLETAKIQRTIHRIGPNDPTVVSLSTNSQGAVTVGLVSVIASAQLQDVRIGASKVVSLPDDVEQPPGQTIQLLNFSTSASDADIERATIKLRVYKAAIPENSTPTVYRYSDGGWSQLETTISSQRGGTVVLTAISPGFSYFAVSTESPAASTPANGQTVSNVTFGETETPSATTSSNQAGANQEDSSSERTTGADGSGFTIAVVLLSIMLFSSWRLKLKQ